jgi:pre-mRNA-splicing factor CWC22
VRKEKFKGFSGVIPELDLVEEQDKITHNIRLDDVLECEEPINFFIIDPNWEQTEAEWDEIK